MAASVVSIVPVGLDSKDLLGVCLWGVYTSLTATHASHTLAYAKPYSRFVTKGITTSLSKDKFSEIKIPGDALHTKKSSLRA